MRVLVLNGPNLDLLGTREPEIYGHETLQDLETMTTDWISAMGAEAVFEQSNSESRIVDLIHSYDGDGIVLNPGALTHTSRSIPDAIRGVDTPVVEVHISDVRGREPWRSVSFVSEACARTIYGRGFTGYRDAVRHLVNRAAMPFSTVRYGPHQEQVGDLRDGGGRLVILVHGGLWRRQYERDTIESLAVDLARRGFDTWNIEYRRLGAGGGWPGSAHDVLTALDFIPQLGRGMAPVTVVSHSAGSQLAAWASPRSRSQLDLHVAMAPLVDLETAVARDDPGAAECSALLESGAPPVVAPDGVSTVIVHGDSDQIVPVERSIAYAETHGLEHHHTGCDHFSLLSPVKPEWDWIIDRIGAVS